MLATLENHFLIRHNVITSLNVRAVSVSRLTRSRRLVTTRLVDKGITVICVWYFVQVCIFAHI